MQDVNILLSFLLNKNSKQRREECKSILSQNDYFEYVKGTPSTLLLKQLLFVSKREKETRGVFAQLLYLSKKETIDNELFDQIKSFPHKKSRRTFLVSLAHCDLSIYQLSYICSKRICVEAYCQLIKLLYSNECFTSYDLRCFLDGNEWIIPEVKVDCAINLIRSGNNGPNDKKELLIEHLKEWEPVVEKM